MGKNLELYFGALFVFIAFYLWIKEYIFKKKGVRLTATLVGFSTTKDATYPLFQFDYEGEEYTIPGAIPANPNRYKYNVGDKVNIIHVPGNKKYVDTEGSRATLIWGVVSLVWGLYLIYVNLK